MRTTQNEKSVANSKEQALTSEIREERKMDYELAHKAAAGDIAAFEEIYWRHHRLVYSLCLKMTRNATEAEDITQDVFVRLYRKIGSFKGEASFSTWLFRFTYNQVLMHFRKVKARREQSNDADENEQIVSKKESAKNSSILDEIALKQAIADLPPGYRKVFFLYAVEGYEHQEIAEILGTAAGTSKSQFHKAKKKLRQLLFNYRDSRGSEI